MAGMARRPMTEDIRKTPYLCRTVEPRIRMTISIMSTRRRSGDERRRSKACGSASWACSARTATAFLGLYTSSPWCRWASSSARLRRMVRPLRMSVPLTSQELTCLVVIETGSPIMIKPSFNPMIGPSTYVLINFGARFTPCMHNVEGITNANETISWPCPSTTSSDTSTYDCTLSDLCGFGGIPEPKYSLDASMSDKPEPNQWWRFILPMFMHAGLIHIAFNLLLQLTMGKEMERSIGSLRFFLVYVCSGIFGFVLGGNYAGAGLASTGASGSLFGVIALTLLDLFYSWSDRVSPVRDLMFIMLDIIISFVLGLLPGVDNFSHIGGLLMGLALGLSVLHSPNALRRRIGDDSPYSTVNSGYTGDKPPGFLKNPVGFFKGRKPFWWAWWLVRAGALLLVFVVFIVLLQNFYVYRNTCSWCKYLSCLVSFIRYIQNPRALANSCHSLSATGATAVLRSHNCRHCRDRRSESWPRISDFGQDTISFADVS